MSFSSGVSQRILVSRKYPRVSDVRREPRVSQVESARPRLHVPSRYGRVEPIPYHTTKRMQRGVGPHQLVSTLPVDRAQDLGSLQWYRPVEPMPDTIAVAGHFRHDEPVITNGQGAGIVRLATPTRIEHRSVEQDPFVINIGPNHSGGHVLCVRVGREDRFCHFETVLESRLVSRNGTHLCRLQPWTMTSP